MSDRLIMERVTRGRAPGREFDIEFWQALGPSRILEAAWDLAITAASRKGIHEDQLRLQRSVEKLERGRRAVTGEAGDRQHARGRSVGRRKRPPHNIAATKCGADASSAPDPLVRLFLRRNRPARGQSSQAAED